VGNFNLKQKNPLAGSSGSGSEGNRVEGLLYLVHPLPRPEGTQIVFFRHEQAAIFLGSSKVMIMFSKLKAAQSQRNLLSCQPCPPGTTVSQIEVN
jgi:hypothetical protein